MKVIFKTDLLTVNRGVRTFTISQSEKGFFAHEIGELTQIAKVIGGDTRNAHRLNPTVKRANQYGKFFKPKPLQLSECLSIIGKAATSFIYRF
jgi:hypothetical protein